MDGESRTYHNGMVTVKILNAEEAAEYRKLKPGVTQTSEMIRSVAIEDGYVHVLEQTGNGVNRIKVKLYRRNMMDIGERIRKRRKELGMTLEEVGKIVGVGKSTVRKWETGMIRNMKIDRLEPLAKALKMEVVDFFK